MSVLLFVFQCILCQRVGTDSSEIDRQGLDVRQREEELGVEVLNAPRWRYTTASDLLRVCLDNDVCFLRRSGWDQIRVADELTVL
jgi:hypothetical protein